MILTTLAVVAAVLLCLAFDATKWIGVAGVALLFVLHPLLLKALSVLGGVAYFLFRHYQRRKCDDIPELPDGRD